MNVGWTFRGKKKKQACFFSRFAEKIQNRILGCEWMNDRCIFPGKKIKYDTFLYGLFFNQYTTSVTTKLLSWALWTISAINGSDEFIHEQFMNTWIWSKAMNPWISNPTNLWTHEFHFVKIHEPVNMNIAQSYEPMNIKSEKLVNPWISFVKNPWKSMNPWIWILPLLWTHEYEY